MKKRMKKGCAYLLALLLAFSMTAGVTGIKTKAADSVALTETGEQTSPDNRTYTLPSGLKDTATTTPYKEHGAITVDMNSASDSYLQIVDQNGNPFQLRGVSTHGLNWDDVGLPYVNFDSFKNARDILNANAVRLACYTTGYMGYADKGAAIGTQSEVQDELLYRIDQGVQTATYLGMYAIVDWHVLNDSNPQKYKADAKVFFDYVSKRYASQGNVVYEICNEPNSDTSWEDIKSYAEEVIPIIRANAPNAIIIVGTPTWSQAVDEPAADPIKDNKGNLMKNVMYTIHFYADSHGSAFRQPVIDAYKKIPIFCTEFGMCDSAYNGTNNFTEATDWLDYFDSVGISYFVWSLCKKSEKASLLDGGSLGSWTADDLSESGNWIKSQYTTRSAENNTIVEGANYTIDTSSVAGTYDGTGENVQSADDVVINEETFPDEVFRNYVKENFDTNSDSVLSVAECEAVRTINVNCGVQVDGDSEYTKITNLKGIEYFTELTELNCNYNDLKELDLTKNMALSKLSCHDSNLESLNITKNVALQNLYCEANHLKKLDVSNNTLLSVLYCFSNCIEELDVRNNLELETLDCSFNNLKNLDITNNTKLASFKCSTDTRDLNLTRNEIDTTTLPGFDMSKVSDVTGAIISGDKFMFEEGIAVISYAYQIREGETVTFKIRPNILSGGGSEDNPDNKPGTSEENPGEDTPGTSEENPGGDTPGTSEENPGGDIPGTSEENPGSNTPGTSEDKPGSIASGNSTTTEDSSVNKNPNNNTSSGQLNNQSAPAGNGTTNPSVTAINNGYQTTVSGLCYKVTSTYSKTAMFTGINKSAQKSKKKIIIPKTIKINGTSYKVTEIKASALANNKYLQAVKISSNVKKIGAKAFCNCKKLKTVAIEAGQLKKVGSKAFYHISKKVKFSITETFSYSKKEKKALVKRYQKMIKKAAK